MGIPYEGNGYASLTFLTWITSSEIVLLVFSVGVLGIAFLMFVRLFDALSPPTKALTWVVGGNLVLALVLLAFACFQMHYYALREFIPQGGAFCHYVNPVVLSLVVFNWLGQPVIAWTTLKTLRNEPVPDRQLWRIHSWSMAVSLVIYLWGVVLSPGVIVNGSFCVMIPKSPDFFEARGFGNLIGLATFFTSLVLYVKSYRHLETLRKKLETDLKRMRHTMAVSEAKELELSSFGPGSNMSQSNSTRELRAAEEGEGSEAHGAERSQASAAGAGSGWEDDGVESVAPSGDDSEDDVPFTYEQLQARTQAARAAVNILLPNRTDDMAEREGLRRRRGSRRSILQEGVDLRVLLEQNAGADSSSSSGSGSGSDSGRHASDERSIAPLNKPHYRLQRLLRRRPAETKEAAGAAGREEEDAHAEVVQLYTKATRALVGRACTLLVVYYLPTYLLYACLGAYKDFRPPPELLPIFGFIFFLGTPVLQTFALLHLAVTIGSNILKFYRQYQQGGGRAAEGEVECEEGKRGAGSGESPVELVVHSPEHKGSGDAVVVRAGGPRWATCPPTLALDVSNSGSSGGTSGGGVYLYEQGSLQRSFSSPGHSAQAAVVGGPGAISPAGAGGGADSSGTGSPASLAEWESEPLNANGVASHGAAHGSGEPGAAHNHQRPPAPRAQAGGGSGRPPAPGPLGVPQPSAFRRYGRKKGAAFPTVGPRHMQALSTIYEVAFKSRGRDAAAAFRDTMGTPAPGATAAVGGAGGGGGVMAVAEKGEQEWGGERKSTASDGSEVGDATAVLPGGGAASLTSSMAATLQQNALVQEMLGVKVQRSSGSSSNGSVGGSGSERSSVVEGSDEASDARGGPAEGDMPTPYSPYGYVQSFFPWRATSRSRSMSLAESEISSLTDAQDYQIGSWVPSPAMMPARKPGAKAVDPFASPASLGGGGENEGEGGCSSGYQSSEISVDSWGESGREAMLGDVPRSTASAAGGGGGGVSLAGMTNVSGSSGASSNSSLVSDGGRSLVTESDWRDWRDWQQNKEEEAVK